MRVALAGDAHGDPAAQGDIQQQVAELIVSMVERGEISAEPTETDDGVPEIHSQPDGSLLVAGVQIRTHQQIIDAWVADLTGQSNALVTIGLGFGMVAVFVAGLVISNTFQVLVASRSRTMALLRAVGATAAQLRRATLAEGALLGLLGGVVGVLLGWAGAVGITFAAQHLWQGSLASAQLSVLAVVIGLSLGVAVTVLAAVMPALRAGRTSPMEALGPVEVSPAQKRVPWVRTGLGMLFALVGLVGVLFAAVLSEPLVGVAGAIMGLTGVLLTGRLLVPAAVSLMGRLLAKLPRLRVPGLLAAQNARAVPGRTAVTTMALLIGVTLVSTMTMGATTAQHSLSAELAEWNPVDASLGTVSAEAEQGLQDSPIVVAHQKLPGTVASLQGEKLVAGPDEGRAIFAADSAVEEIARSESLFQDEHGEGPVALISPELLVNGRAETAEITLTPHSPADGAAEAITATAVPASWVPADTVVLLAASVVVAVVGVSNTLTLSVFERRREAALLRAMGMTRGSVGAMVTLEALLMAAVALVLGSGLGAFLAWGGVSSLVAHEEVTVVLGVPWDRMARIWGVTLVAAVLASLLPARALFRIPPAAGLSAQ